MKLTKMAGSGAARQERRNINKQRKITETKRND